ncbi:MAG: hypothetical protein H0W73_11655 [Bacteroidetes bacterium]|nr:hypothetical protein [Bacteroidota bacterium]
MYGGIEKFDAGKFYTDAATINSYAYTEPFGYLKLLFGLQDESPGTNLYDNFITHTTQWDNGRLKDYLYNDNRVVIRVYSLLHFIAFNSYYVHALISCFLSFISITFLYRSIKDFFVGKELFVLLILCFLPALWFYTGALLKEGLVLFILGSTLYLFKQYFLRDRKWYYFILIPVLFFASLLLKPYILLFAFCLFGVFFRLYYSKKIQRKTLYFLSFLILIVSILNLISIGFKHKSLLSAAIKHQRMFADASKGGIFLLDRSKFVRLEFDSSLVKKVNNNDSIFTIKKDVPYIYWEHWHQQDTLFTTANTDITTQYKLVYQLPKSGSNITVDLSKENVVVAGGMYLYYSLFYPFFFNSKSLLQHLASLENLLILISIIIFFFGLIQNKKDNFPAITFMIFALLLCLLIGLTTPNSGAIFRYRSPAVIFILLAALYYLPVIKNPGKATLN